MYKNFSKLLSLQKTLPLKISCRNVQVSIIGAGSEIGSNLATLLVQRSKIEHLKLYDDDEKIKGVGMEISQIPSQTVVSTFAGSHNIGPAVNTSDIVVMVSRFARKPGDTREQMISWNVPPLMKLCRGLLEYNPHAILAISTNPLNSIVPFAGAYLHKYKSWNPYKLLGITQIDTYRSRAYAGKILGINPEDLKIPVIGGHSDHTIIPLFSNMQPSTYKVDSCQADTLTRLVRKAGTEVVINKQGVDSATLSMAYSIFEFVDGLVDAVLGSEVILNCYTVNPFFGTRYFSAPNKIGRSGLVKTCSIMPMSDFETHMLSLAVPLINKDIAMGEEYVQYVEDLGCLN